jgi:pantoate--beta-alanine ligase
MVRDLNMPVKIEGLATVREPDGLALSSRNKYLDPEARAQAPVIRRALIAGAKNIRTAARVVPQIIRTAPLAKIDYVEVFDAVTLKSLTPGSRRALIAVAVFFGKTRLIDNITVPL